MDSLAVILVALVLVVWRARSLWKWWQYLEYRRRLRLARERARTQDKSPDHTA